MYKLPINPKITDVLKAHKFLRDKVRHTPTEYSYPLSDMAGAPVYLKLENDQLCGSFKLRGALYKMSSLNETERAAGVVTCSSGNHGQGVALAASKLKIKTKIFVPNVCPNTKKQAIKRRGGDYVELTVSDGNYDFAEHSAQCYAKEHNAVYVSSFEDADVIAGQGTAAFEMLTDEPDIDLILVPAGGGGLLNGTAIAAKALNPDAEIWGVQSEASNPWVASWPDGRVKDVEYYDTLADGLAGYIPQSMLDLAKLRVSGIYEVTEEEIAKAIVFMHREHRLVVEGAGAAGIAALLAGKAETKGRTVGVIVSGGNIDEDTLKTLLEKY